MRDTTSEIVDRRIDKIAQAMEADGELDEDEARLLEDIRDGMLMLREDRETGIEEIPGEVSTVTKARAGMPLSTSQKTRQDISTVMKSLFYGGERQ